LAGSVAESDAGREGYQTFVDLNPEKPLIVTTIMGVAPASGFVGPVVDVCKSDDGVVLIDTNGAAISVPLDVDQLYSS
jgi:hypothetical protein